MNDLNQTALYVLFIVAGGMLCGGCAKKTSPPPPAPASIQSSLDAATEAVRKSPTFETYIQLGLVQLNSHLADEAMKSFAQSVRLSPKSAVGFNNLCAAANETKHWSVAIEACEHALSLAPDMQLAQNNLRLAKDSQQKTAERISALEAKFQDSKDAALMIQVGMEFYATGEYDKAISAWKKVPQDSKFWAIAQNDIASAAISKKDFPVARAAIEKALLSEPHNPLYLNNRNWLARTEKEASGN